MHVLLLRLCTNFLPVCLVPGQGLADSTHAPIDRITPPRESQDEIVEDPAGEKSTQAEAAEVVAGELFEEVLWSRVGEPSEDVDGGVRRGQDGHGSHVNAHLIAHTVTVKVF